tara:strand:- start:15549 stop:15782 length:234 start_codon:yes stop_codon:yes gene_type:complete
MSAEIDFYNLLAETVLKHRKQAGLSQKGLADYAGVGKTAVYDIEHSKQGVQINTLLKVLTVLNIQLVLQTPVQMPEA